MNKPIHPAVAEHVMEENARLREVLRCIADLPMDRCSTENDYRLSAAKAIALGALSQQAEPCQDCDNFGDVHGPDGEYIGRCKCGKAEPATPEERAAWIDSNVTGSPELIRAMKLRAGCGEQAEPAPAQDEREAPKEVDKVAFIKLRDGKRWRLYWEDEFAQGDQIEPLMTVAQHERIVASLTRPAQTEQQPEQSGLVPEGYALVPITPTEEQWSGLARHLMMWLDMSDKTAQGLFKHLRMLGVEPPQWLRDEPEMQGAGVPSKGTRVTLIYRAMIEDFLATLSTKGGEK